MSSIEKEKDLVSFLINELFPIFRSITGIGIVRTIQILGKYIPLKLTKFKSGLKVNDWTVPLEWIIKSAYIITQEKKKSVI